MATATRCRAVCSTSGTRCSRTTTHFSRTCQCHRSVNSTTDTCEALTRGGARCKNYACADDGVFCTVHKNNTIPRCVLCLRIRTIACFCTVHATFFKLHKSLSPKSILLPTDNLANDIEVFKDYLDIGSWMSINTQRYFFEHLKWSVERRIRKHILASRIKRAFRRAISDPNYKMCRDRLLREFEESENMSGVVPSENV